MSLVKLLCVVVIVVAIFASGCTVGPNYHRLSAPTPQTYKEPEGWKPITPKYTIDRGAWWSVYRDSELDHLERQVSISNQNVKFFSSA